MLVSMWKRHRPGEIPKDLRSRLETARLDLLTLFRALDGLNLPLEQLPQRLLSQLFELDADFVEALWALDQPPGKLDMATMLADTLPSLDQAPAACARFRQILPSQIRRRLSPLETSIRAHLLPAEAYSMVPGRNPQIG